MYSIKLDSGSTPKNIVLTLFMKAKRKNISVCQALTNNRWMHFYSPYTHEKEIKEFISLLQGINNTHELNDIDDTILWRWKTDRSYSSSSAYKIQFTTIFCKIKISPIWKAKIEPKCRFFAWTMLHNRILNVDNLQKRE
jgi:hypothetical protein